ncbi:MAG: flavodoxin family protein [Firmicutes bacterium]|nr:flavodoxin family protein [Bacillota bacterium]
MKTIIINGSPRKSGNTSSLISCLVPLLDSEVQVISPYSLDISPCTDCRHCHTFPECIIKDDMTALYAPLLSADNIIIASPLYFSELTSGVLTLASRFQFFYTSRFVRGDLKSIKPKKAAVILVGGGSSKTDEKALSTASIILSSLNAKVIASLSYINTDILPASEDSSVLLRLKEIAYKLSGCK